MIGTIERVSLLPVFVEVVRQGSFTAAAAQLGLPKSTVSRRVTKLEQELGVALLVRTTRSVRLTDAGEALYTEASVALERLEEASQAVAEAQRVPRGTLRVTAPTDLGSRHLAALFARFVERYPEVRVELVLTGRRVDLVSEGFDVAIRAGPLTDSSLVARRLGVADLALFASTDYLARRGEPAELADLAHHECVPFRPQAGVSRFSLTGPDGRRETVELRGRLGADDFAFIAEAVRAGAGIALAPEPFFTDDLAKGSVKAILCDWRVSGSALHLVYPGARHLPAKLVAFRDFMVEGFAHSPFAAPSRP